MVLHDGDDGKQQSKTYIGGKNQQELELDKIQK